QRDRLALPTGKQVHAVLHPVLKAQIELRDPLAEELSPMRAERRSQPPPLAAAGCQRKVLLDREGAAASRKRVLEDTGDKPGAGRRRFARDVGGSDRHLAL